MIDDKYYHKVCETIASKSPCFSRKIGAILVRDNIIISLAYNGSANTIPNCGRERILNDRPLYIKIYSSIIDIPRKDIDKTCPRQLMKDYKSGSFLEYCNAIHAEQNCINQAARAGVSTLGSILYMNYIIPCKDCLSSLINAGIKEIVVEKLEYYDIHTKFIADYSDIKIREFDI